MADPKAAVYVKNVPEFTLDEGLVHVCHTTGAIRFELVMRPHTFLKALRAANRVADEFHETSRAIPLKAKP